MLILGIDTSCDDTSASLMEMSEGIPRIITNIVSSQTDIHDKYGGIVPELASRRHIEMIWPVADEAISGHIDEIDAVAVCQGPGLIGSLLVGTSFAKSLCYAKKIPLVPVNHLEGHLYSAFIRPAGPNADHSMPEFPFLTLIVSGGHTCIYKVEGHCQYTELGRTRDDAAGEAFDKVSKLLGLGYPGGPIIDGLAAEGNPKAVRFPRAYLPDTLDFSFSGLKTAVLNFLREEENRDIPIKDVCASFQASVTDVLVRKTEWAVKKYGIRRLSVSGGVAANGGLRQRLIGMCNERDTTWYLPPKNLCTDNAAMIALAGYYRYTAGERAGLDLNPLAYLPL